MVDGTATGGYKLKDKHEHCLETSFPSKQFKCYYLGMEVQDMLLTLVKITLLDTYIYTSFFHLCYYDIISCTCVYYIYIYMQCSALWWVIYRIFVGYLYTLFTLPQLHVHMDTYCNNLYIYHPLSNKDNYM